MNRSQHFKRLLIDNPHLQIKEFVKDKIEEKLEKIGELSKDSNPHYEHGSPEIILKVNRRIYEAIEKGPHIAGNMFFTRLFFRGDLYFRYYNDAEYARDYLLYLNIFSDTNDVIRKEIGGPLSFFNIGKSFYRVTFLQDIYLDFIQEVSQKKDVSYKNKVIYFPEKMYKHFSTYSWKEYYKKDIRW